MTEESSNQKSFLQSFTKEDAKLFIVTAIATVVANVATVIIVALAILLARSRPHPVPPDYYLFTAVLTISFTVSAIAGPFMIATVWKGRSLNDRFMKWAGLIVFSAVIICAIIFTLTWIGIAEGIN